MRFSPKLLGLLALTTACNAILGNEERTRAVDAGGSSGSGASSMGAATGSGGTNMPEAGQSTGGSAGMGASAGTAGSSMGDAGAGGSAGAGAGGAGECTTGDARCSPTGEPEACQGSEWQSLGACDSATPVCFDGTCVECVPDTFNCTGRRLDHCTGGVWELVKNCPNTAPVCNAVAGDCVNLALKGGLTTLGPSAPSSKFIVQGELLLQTRTCDSGVTRCVRGGLVP